MSIFSAFFLPAALVLTEFVLFLFSRGLPRWLFRATEVLSVLGLPIFFLGIEDYGLKNTCCSDTALFSPTDRPAMYALIVLCMLTYFISTYKRRALPPIPEVTVNCLLLIGIALNLALIAHLGWNSRDAALLWLPGNVPVILLFVMALVRNHRHFLAQQDEPLGRSWAERTCWQLLRSPALAKFPLLLVLCIPVLALLSGVLMLFGQRPDAFIRAFTDTYRYGFSQLDHECVGVVCGGHYLCTIAAKGHAQVVRPLRLGVRGGHTIVCNRQLLVSNAFEELLQQRWPTLHRRIRGTYDHVGGFVHRYYGAFDRKWVSDLVFVLMKPLEWGFLLVLYSCDHRPEQRIAVQYLRAEDRSRIPSARAAWNGTSPG